MSVTTYDSSFSYRQNQVARLGDKAAQRGPMSAEERKKFEQSPFMQKMKEIDERSWERFSERDKKRKQKDPSFTPSDKDFEAPKAHKYDKSINYYKVLGIDEYSTLDEVKKAYRKLSLTYHPDKTNGKSQEEKDEFAPIFIEVKNAYKTLSDEPTRRQYDFDRDRDLVSADTHGKKPQEKLSFNAVEAMKKILEKTRENQKAPGEVVRIPVQIRLEKLVFGGNKAIMRSRQILDRMYGGFTENVRVFRIDIPAGAEQPYVAEFKRQGDQHLHKEADTLRFTFTAKSHAVVDRSANDLYVRQVVELGEGYRRRPTITAETPSIAGKHILLFGANPFVHQRGGQEGELRLKIVGEGATPKGSLHVRLQMGLGLGSAAKSGASVPSPAENSQAKSAQEMAEREFIKKFNLGPIWGFEDTTPGTSSSSTSPAPPSPSEALKARLEKLDQRRQETELELHPEGPPLGLFSKPTCYLQLYSCDREGKPPFFAVCVSSQPCAAQRAAGEWASLKAKLLPVLQRTVFTLFRGPRQLLPRALARTSANPDRTFLPSTKAASAAGMPWKVLGDQAFRSGNYWEAARLYGLLLKELGLYEAVNCEPIEELDTACSEIDKVEAGAARKQKPDEEVKHGPDQIPESAKLLSNLAGVWSKLGQHEAALRAASLSKEKAERWARPWSRLAVASWEVGQKHEAVAAYKKAVELEVSKKSLEALQKAVAAAAEELQGEPPPPPSLEAAHSLKEEANSQLRSGFLNLAAATYTEAIARLPALSGATPGQDRDEEHLRTFTSVLFTNRAGTLLRLRLFDLAVADGEVAVSAQPALSSARCQLGAAYLAGGKHQEAYSEFAKALQLEQDSHPKARKGRNACLQEMLLWKSEASNRRFQNRFFMDLRRPRSTTRIFALSDIHFDHRENENWVQDLDDCAFQEDVLIVAGNIGDSRMAVNRCLTTLKQKFRRVFYTVGNHEMSITMSEHAKYPDSITKLNMILQDCDDLSVDVFPAPVCEGLTILPLFSWYSAEFDEADPFPDPNSRYDQHCKWPMDPDLQLWKYMTKLNEAFLARPYHGLVVSFSHFLPRRNLPFDKTRKSAAKAVGCEWIDGQVRAANSKLHVYGHSRKKYQQSHSGVRYVNMPLGFETDWPRDHERQLMLIFDGKNLCAQEWNQDGDPPLGYVKRLVHTTCLVMPTLKEADRRKLQAVVAKLNTFAGIQVSFDAVGSKRKNRQDFVKDFLPELATAGADVTHVFLVVAQDIESMKGLFGSEVYKRDFAGFVGGLSNKHFSLASPLGLDLKFERKADPIIFLFGLRLTASVTEDSDEYAKLQKAVEAINKLPGVEGKIAMGLQPAGFGRFSHRELQAELGLDSILLTTGSSYVCYLFADSPESWKMLSQSKTYAKWKAAYEAVLSKVRSDIPANFVTVLPLEIAATAAAPKKEKKSQRVAAKYGSQG